MSSGTEEAEARCSACGKPLVGRDRYEGKCGSCREAEALGPEDAPSGQAVECVACGAANPPGRVRCSECGASLVVPGPSRRFLALALVLGALAIGAAAAVVFGLFPRKTQPTSPPSPPPLAREPVEPAAATSRLVHPVSLTPALSPPEEARVREETRELLSLVARGDLDRAIDNYLQSDEKDFPRVERALDAIVAGDAQAGFTHWSVRLIKEGRSRVAAALRRLGDPDPGWSVAFLAMMSRTPEVSSPHYSAEDRARAALKWHLRALFDGLEPATARVRRVGRTLDGRYVVAIQCQGERKAKWLRGEPMSLLWEKQAVGWVLKVSLAERLERLSRLLRSAVNARHELTGARSR